MECRTIDQRMDAYLDRELDPASAVEVEAHLAACGRCRREWGGLVTLVNDPLPVEVPLGLRDRIWARMQEEVPAHPARVLKTSGQQVRWMRWHRYVTAAAACMAFFVTGWLVSGWWRGAPTQVVEKTTKQQTPVVVVASPWMMSSLAQAAAFPGPMSPAVVLAQGLMPELMVTPVAMDEPAPRVRPHNMRVPTTRPADPLTAPELRALPMVPRFMGA